MKSFLTARSMPQRVTGPNRLKLQMLSASDEDPKFEEMTRKPISQHPIWTVKSIRYC
jgi:hypothetical protein